MIGNTYGILTVISKDKSRGKNARWLCRCKCGAVASYTTNYIKNNTISRCAKCNAVKYINRGTHYEGIISDGTVFTFDLDDYDVVSKYTWATDAKGYVWCRYGDNRKPVRLHRLVTNAPCGMEVDHIDGNRLNNRKLNLRLCSTAQNCANRGLRKDNTSGFAGVKYDSGKNKWSAGIGHERKYTHLGYYDSLSGAVKARLNAEAKYHGEFAHKKTVYTAGGELLAQQ